MPTIASRFSRNPQAATSLRPRGAAGTGPWPAVTHPAQRADDPWARPHIGRILAISLLDRVGIHLFDGLPVIDFAVAPGSEVVQTGRYSHRLLFSLLPADHRTLLRAARIPLLILIAENDEMFSRAAFAPAVHPFRPDARIVVVQGVNHIGLTLDPRALASLLHELR